MLTGVLAGAHPLLANKKNQAPREMPSAANYDEKKLQLAIGKASTGYKKSFNQYTTGGMDDQEKLQPVTKKLHLATKKA